MILRFEMIIMNIILPWILNPAHWTFKITSILTKLACKCCVQGHYWLTMSSIGLGHVKQGLAGRTLLSGKEEATLLWMIITQQPVFCHAESPPPPPEESLELILKSSSVLQLHDREYYSHVWWSFYKCWLLEMSHEIFYQLCQITFLEKKQTTVL